MTFILSLLLFANVNSVAVLPKETKIAGRVVMCGKQKRNARRKLERGGF